MRTETISGLEVIYPNYMVWDNDNNYVMLKVPTGRQAVLRVTIGSRTVSYASEGDVVVVDISLLLKRNAVYGAVTMSAYIATVTPAYSTTRTYNIYVCRGWTLADRYHFSGRKIILPYGATAVDIPCADACTITGGTAAASVAGASIVSYGITASSVVTVTYGGARMSGYINDPTKSTTVKYDVEILGCMPDSGALIMWYDSDGCRRYIAGKILTRGSRMNTIEYNGAQYGDDDATIRNTVGRVVSSLVRTIEVGIAQVGEAVHLEEILFSSGVYLVNPSDNSTLPIVPDFSELAVSMKDIEDVVLKFKVQQ